MKKIILYTVLALLLFVSGIIAAVHWYDYGLLGTGNIADDDTFLMLDISDPTMNPVEGTNKQMKWSTIKTALGLLFGSLSNETDWAGNQDYGDTTMTLPPVMDFSAATRFEIMNGTDPDCDEEGEISYDTDAANENNDEAIRAGDGTNQWLVGRKIKCIPCTVVKPNDLADAQRDQFPMWPNNTGMVFTITEIKAWSDTDDTELNVEVVTATDWSSPTTVDAIDIDTNGTSVYYDVETAFSDSTIAHDEIIVLDFDDTDDPGFVQIVICGWFNANID